ncbi:MAG: NAD(P)-dependent oxidoreductase [Firmicutes bacterium]|jgi:3-hydroxyisobutyrate dehydrogenase-like beta-hydroxyacid dehydrogenase|nr:NAD(P)-dependent oxidoreductase [Bacillota bacterium]
MAKIAWIGTGVMGASMAGHLSQEGHELFLFNRTHTKAVKVAEQIKAKAFDTIAETVKDADFIFTIVGYPHDVEEVMLKPQGVFDSAKKGSLIIDMTTSLPSLAVKLYQIGQERGLKLLDAPVSGGDSGARNGTLSIMVGGDQEDFKTALPLFEAMGQNIVHMGVAGNGQHTKAANQIAVAGATAAMTEAIVYSKKVGLEPEAMLKAIGAGAAGSWQLQNMAPRVLQKDFDPGFFVKHFIKDMKIVNEEMEERDTHLEMLNTVLNLYLKMAEAGFEDDGTQALIKLYEEQSSC